MTEPDPRGSAEPPSAAIAGRMLRICLGGEQPLVEAARSALAAGGAPWWEETIAMVGAAEGLGAATFLPGGAGLAELERWKEAAKAWARRDDPADAPPRGTLVYLAATALALAEHGARLSTRPAAELVPAWLDLADVAPEPWPGILARAALRAERPGG